jgi:dihydrofolate reductase
LAPLERRPYILHMAKLTITTFMTLDGVMQAPGGPKEDPSGGFVHGGWSFPYADADFGGFMTEVFGRADAFLLGRYTYQIFEEYWPKVKDKDNPIAAALNTLPKYIASKTLDRVDWANSELIRDVTRGVAELKGRYGREIQVHGSAGLAQTLIRHDLIDRYNLLFFPVILGAGKRLFGGGSFPKALTLVSSKTTSSGIAIHVYENAGKPTYGSF